MNTLISALNFVENQVLTLFNISVQEDIVISGIAANVSNIQAGNFSSFLSNIQQNGIMLSNRWRLGLEPLGGEDLILRDTIATSNGGDARYKFGVGKKVDL